LPLLRWTLELVITLEDLTSTNKALRSGWHERRSSVLVMVRDLIAAKPSKYQLEHRRLTLITYYPCRRDHHEHTSQYLPCARPYHCSRPSAVFDWERYVVKGGQQNISYRAVLIYCVDVPSRDGCFRLCASNGLQDAPRGCA
jgi:hypothetical protein